MTRPARGFALEHAHYTRDIPFWRAAAARLGSPVLDLGCATGRVALPLARDGAEVWALDRSPAMLAELGRLLEAEPPEVRERVRPVPGDLAGFRLDRDVPAGADRHEHPPGAHRARRPRGLPVGGSRAPRRRAAS